MFTMEESFTLVCLFCLMTCRVQASALGNNKAPNIIMILADDMGFDDVSFRGPKEFLTPNIDALGYHGRVLDRLYAEPLCTPSRAAMLSGKYPISTGMQHFIIRNEEPWGLPLNVTTIAEIFQARGYSTNLIGKWHLGFGRKEQTPTYRGFDYHYGYWGGFIDYYQRKARMEGNFSIGYDFRRNMNLECGDRGTYVTDLLTNEAERVILQNNGTKSLFLMLHHLAPHAASLEEPLQAPEEEVNKFQHISNPDRRKYAAMMARLDQSVGRVTQALDRANMLQNSILIFQSDNGAPSIGLFANTGSNWPLRGQKNTPWEGGVRVAGAIWSPLITARNTVFRQPIHISDWLPTLAAAANIPLDSNLNLDGINLWPALVSSKNKPLIEREMVHNLDDIWHVVSYMNGNFKYINGTTRGGTADDVLTQRELYEIDPKEQRYVEEVQNSLTSQSLKNFDQKRLTKRRINNLRKSLNVNCGYLKRSCNPLIEDCLFNIMKDPCEQNNLAYENKYRTVLQQMRDDVERLRERAMPPGNIAGKDEYDPSWHNCDWDNFVEVPATKVPLNCDVSNFPCGN